mmetsp:Transcript_26573/g.39481  ORF Transcript_26573/g.39481 Transcript_26573/m.39481 type:complete len:336 (+) Transcript_26573:72-1079(+)
MGSQSSKVDPYYDQHVHNSCFDRTFSSLSLSERDVSLMYEIFFPHVSDNSNNKISIESLFQPFRSLHVCTFTKQVFGLCGRSDDCSMDFREFVLGLWGLCTLQEDFISLYLFDVIDTKKKGVIQYLHIIQYVFDAYGWQFNSNEAAKKCVQHIRAASKTTISYDREAFVDLCSEQFAMVGPVVDLQRHMCEAFLGTAFWRGLAARRRKKYFNSSKYISVEMILRYGGDRDIIAKELDIQRLDYFESVIYSISGKRRLKRKKSIFQTLFEQGSDALRQRSKDLRRMAGDLKRSRKREQAEEDRQRSFKERFMRPRKKLGGKKMTKINKYKVAQTNS